jgi:hypothetical protein
VRTGAGGCEECLDSFAEFAPQMSLLYEFRLDK